MQRKKSSAKTGRTMLKTALVAPAATLYAWAVQQATAGAYTTAGVAVVVATLMMGAFVLAQEYDLPYEEEIVDVVDDQVTQREVERAGKEASREIADEINQRTGSNNDNGSS